MPSLTLCKCIARQRTVVREETDPDRRRPSQTLRNNCEGLQFDLDVWGFAARSIACQVILWAPLVIAVLAHSPCAPFRLSRHPDPHFDPPLATLSSCPGWSGGSVGPSRRRSSSPVVSAGSSDGPCGFTISMSTEWPHDAFRVLALVLDFLPWSRVALALSVSHAVSPTLPSLVCPDHSPSSDAL